MFGGGLEESVEEVGVLLEGLTVGGAEAWESGVEDGPADAALGEAGGERFAAAVEVEDEWSGGGRVLLQLRLLLRCLFWLRYLVGVGVEVDGVLADAVEVDGVGAGRLGVRLGGGLGGGCLGREGGEGRADCGGETEQRQGAGVCGHGERVCGLVIGGVVG